jgi:hypothetical protein
MVAGTCHSSSLPDGQRGAAGGGVVEEVGCEEEEVMGLARPGAAGRARQGEAAARRGPDSRRQGSPAITWRAGGQTRAPARQRQQARCDRMAHAPSSAARPASNLLELLVLAAKPGHARRTCGGHGFSRAAYRSTTSAGEYDAMTCAAASAVSSAVVPRVSTAAMPNLAGQTGRHPNLALLLGHPK